jgi:hypothetical protein
MIVEDKPSRELTVCRRASANEHSHTLPLSQGIGNAGQRLVIYGYSRLMTGFMYRR